MGRRAGVLWLARQFVGKYVCKWMLEDGLCRVAQLYCTLLRMCLFGAPSSVESWTDAHSIERESLYTRHC